MARFTKVVAISLATTLLSSNFAYPLGVDASFGGVSASASVGSSGSGTTGSASVGAGGTSASASASVGGSGASASGSVGGSSSGGTSVGIGSGGTSVAGSVGGGSTGGTSVGIGSGGASVGASGSVSVAGNAGAGTGGTSVGIGTNAAVGVGTAAGTVTPVRGDPTVMVTPLDTLIGTMVMSLDGKALGVVQSAVKTNGGYTLRIALVKSLGVRARIVKIEMKSLPREDSAIQLGVTRSQFVQEI